MSGLEILIYIVLIIFYLLSRALSGSGKNRQQQEEGHTQQYNKEPAQNTQSSRDFENPFSLDEFFGGEERHYDKPASQGKESPRIDHSGGIDFEDAREEEGGFTPQYFSGNYQKPANEEQDQEKLEELQEKIRKARQKNKAKPSKQRDKPRVQIPEKEQRQRDEDYRIRQQESKADRYRRQLKNPQSIRDAFVLKEILDRKF